MSDIRVRAAVTSDAERIAALARYLNSVNLPDDPERVADIALLSERSFSAQIQDPKEREYVFVLEDAETQQIIGTSMIFGQLGNRKSPYVYVNVTEEERYSETLDKHFRHTVLNVGYSYDGPTEIGGLVVHPEHRKGRHGQLISYARFLYIALRRGQFRDQVLAELLPPLEHDGTSHLWEALGRHFTGLTYRDADRLSKTNKEFIRGLFPAGDIYASLLAPEAQSVIGKVGHETRGVEKMLRRIGFRYWDRVDPFDGGPHFVADTDRISLVEQTVIGTCSSEAGVSPDGRYLVGLETSESPYFVAFFCEGRANGKTLKVARTLPPHERSAWLRLP